MLLLLLRRDAWRLQLLLRCETLVALCCCCCIRYCIRLLLPLLHSNETNNAGCDRCTRTRRTTLSGCCLALAAIVALRDTCRALLLLLHSFAAAIAALERDEQRCCDRCTRMRRATFSGCCLSARAIAAFELVWNVLRVRS